MTTNSLKNQLRHTMRRDLWITVAPAALLIGLAFAVKSSDAVTQVSA
jgi:hypothetical protein